MKFKNFIYENYNYLYIYYSLCVIFGYLLCYIHYKKGYWPFNKKDK